MATDFESEIKNALVSYVEEVQADVSDVVVQVAKEAAEKLKRSSPNRTGKYARGWASRAVTDRLGTNAVVYGKKDTYPLAHLLEHGHAKRGGGRVNGIVHIKPVEEWAIAEAEKRIIEKVQK